MTIGLEVLACFRVTNALSGYWLIMFFVSEEHVVSFLPLSHLAAQMGDIYMMAQSGGTVHFAQPDALKGSILETLKEVFIKQRPINILIS